MRLVYFLVNKLYPILKPLSDIYFHLITFVFTIGYLFVPKKTVKPTTNELLLISATEAAQRIRERKISSLALVEAYISRILEVNPQINALVANNFEDAKEEAEHVDLYIKGLNEDDEQISRLAREKPLFGVPFSCKNNMKVKGFVSVAGYYAYVDNPKEDEDSDVVNNLRASGAILLCLTNLPKLAMNWNSENEVYGRTNNPYDLRRVPGGSSGGESALIAAAGSLFGPGNDLGGSVRIPSAFCGLFGLKPTMGLVSLEGFVPEIKGKYAREQWAIGPLCRYAQDLPIVLKAMAGERALKENTIDLSRRFDFRKVKFFTMEELKIVFVQTLHADMREAVRKTRKFFERRFDVVAQVVDFPLAHHMYEIFGALGFDDTVSAPGISEIFESVRKYIKKESDKTVGALIFDVLELFITPGDNNERNEMLERRKRLKEQIISLLAEDGILIFPAFATPASFHLQQPFQMFNLAYCQLFNILGLPAIVCPLGLNSDGNPISVQLVGAPYSEPLLIAAAQEMEREGFAKWIQPGL